MVHTKVVSKYLPLLQPKESQLSALLVVLVADVVFFNSYRLRPRCPHRSYLSFESGTQTCSL
jgi:hypothetical protein